MSEFYEWNSVKSAASRMLVYPRDRDVEQGSYLVNGEKLGVVSWPCTCGCGVCGIVWEAE